MVLVPKLKFKLHFNYTINSKKENTEEGKELIFT